MYRLQKMYKCSENNQFQRTGPLKRKEGDCHTISSNYFLFQYKN